MRPNHRAQFSQKCGNLLKTEAGVLASKVNILNFFQLIMKIYIKIDLLTPYGLFTWSKISVQISNLQKFCKNFTQKKIFFSHFAKFLHNFYKNLAKFFWSIFSKKRKELQPLLGNNFNQRNRSKFQIDLQRICKNFAKSFAL